jgi:putative RNA 2'-phosphotransferase
MARAPNTSKLLSLILRHRPQDFGVTLDAQGWTSVEVLLEALAARGVALSRRELLALVRDNDKQRFAISPDRQRIRANQGHSVGVDLQHAQAEPPDILFHGTVARFLPSIRKGGLLKGRRHHVHLSATLEQAAVVGARRGASVILEVHAGRMHADGHVFQLSPNGVWLAEAVPPGYLVFPD